MDVGAGAPAGLPEGRPFELPGRGTTYLREVPGPPGAPVLVLLHGWTANAALNWFPSFAPLGEHYRVLALDHRGHGRGIRLRGNFRLEDCADDVAVLAGRLGLTRIIPVGYSMGGPIAALVWRRHRGLVRGLVLCATAARFADGSPRARMMTQGMMSLGVAASFSPAALRRQAMARMVNNHLDGTRHTAWSTEELARNDPAALLRAGAALGRYDARPWIHTIDVPTAVVVTEADRVVTPAIQLAQARAIPGAEVFPVAGDHPVCALGPELFVPVLLAACESVARRSAPPEHTPPPTTTPGRSPLPHP